MGPGRPGRAAGGWAGYPATLGPYAMPAEGLAMKIVWISYPGGPAATEVPELLGCAENALGLTEFVRSRGHELVTTSETGPALDPILADATVVIATPFWPAYITRERLARMPNVRLLLTARGGLGPLRPGRRGRTGPHRGRGHGQQRRERRRARDPADPRARPKFRSRVPGGSGGRMGHRVRRGPLSRSGGQDRRYRRNGTDRTARALRLRPFEVTVYYYDNRRLTTAEEEVLGARYRSLDALLPLCDVVSINAPLTPATDRLFDRDRLRRMKRGAYLVNTARGRIVDTTALVDALKDGHLAGYAGDVWFPQPAPKDHPWRTMPHHAMTPHVSGTTLEAQRRYADGIRDCLTRFFDDQPLDRDFLIVENGKFVSPSYSYAFQ